MLQASDLWKSYGQREVVAGITLRAESGEILGLLGPNGAGKTTTVSLLCGLLKPDRGSITLDGESIAGDASAVKRRIGIAPQELALYEDLSAMRNLELFGALYGVAGAQLTGAASRALELVGLMERAKDKPATFSGGMKRRLNIACALVHDPDVLLLDEPTVGVDPQSRNAIFGNIETLRDRGKTVVYTTHYMEEAERLCDRIVIIDHGKVIASDTLQGLAKQVPVLSALKFEVDGTVDTALLAAEPGVRSTQYVDGQLVVGIDDLAHMLPLLLSWLAGRGHTVRGIASSQAGLEDVFLALTGRQLRD
jgi:ABC-2 type transport system ATP-binding protein